VRSLWIAEIYATTAASGDENTSALRALNILWSYYCLDAVSKATLQLSSISSCLLSFGLQYMCYAIKGMPLFEMFH